MNLPPLQTHEAYDKEWVPPESGSRFFSCDHRDTWLRDAGLGSFKSTLKKLYDVRLRDMTLCGYININPSQDGYRRVHIPVMVNPREAYLYRPDDAYRGTQFRDVLLESEDVTINNAAFSCWLIRSPDDASLLLESGGLVLGIDRLRELQKKIMRVSQNSYQYGMSPMPMPPQIMFLSIEEINRNYLKAIGR